MITNHKKNVKILDCDGQNMQCVNISERHGWHKNRFFSANMRRPKDLLTSAEKFGIKINVELAPSR